MLKREELENDAKHFRPLPTPRHNRKLGVAPSTRLAAVTLAFLFGHSSDFAAATTTGPIQHTAAEVLLVINSDSPTSQAVGAYYQQARGITNVVTIQCQDSATDPDNEAIDYPDYLTEIADPISTYLATHPAINFIVLTKGIPLGVEDAPYGSGEKLGDGVASVDSCLAALNYPKVVGARKVALNSKYYAGNIGYAYLNRYYNATAAFTHAKFGGYLVTRLDGYTEAEAESLVDNSLAADGSVGTGPILLDVEPDYNIYPIGNPLETDNQFYNADMLNLGSILEASSIPCDVAITETFVGNQSNLLGYFSFGSNDDNFSVSAYDSLSFAPGAIGDTAVSTSARTMIGSPGQWPAEDQSLIADLIAHGITGAEGYVSEPQIYVSSPSLDMTHYLQGFTLAESFYAGNEFIAWEGVILGDPLCAPYYASTTKVITPTRASTARIASRGVVKEYCSEGLQDMAVPTAGDYLYFLATYPDTATSLIARVASTNSDSTSITIHLDSPTGTVVGTLTVPPTGDQTWTTVTCSLATVTKAHRYYIVFDSGNDSFEWFAFLTTPVTPALVPGAKVALNLAANGANLASGATALAADASLTKAAQQFQVVSAGSGHIALLSLATGRYVTADPSGASPLAATSSSIGINETFAERDLGGANVALMSLANGRYVTVNLASTQAFSRARSVTPAETFSVQSPK